MEVDHVLNGEPSRSRRWKENNARRWIPEDEFKLIQNTGSKPTQLPTQILAIGWWPKIKKSTWTCFLQTCLQTLRAVCRYLGFGIRLFLYQRSGNFVSKDSTQRNWHHQPHCHAPRRKVVKGESESAAIQQNHKLTHTQTCWEDFLMNLQHGIALEDWNQLMLQNISCSTQGVYVTEFELFHTQWGKSWKSPKRLIQCCVNINTQCWTCQGSFSIQYPKNTSNS